MIVVSMLVKEKKKKTDHGILVVTTQPSINQNKQREQKRSGYTRSYEYSCYFHSLRTNMGASAIRYYFAILSLGIRNVYITEVQFTDNFQPKQSFCQQT